MSKFDLPDGEYEIEISELLQQHLVNVHSNNTTILRNHKNDEILSIKYNNYPENLDTSKLMELEKDDKKLGSFKLKASSINEEEEIVFEGQAAESRDIDCIVIYNESTNKLELQRLGFMLRTTSTKAEHKEHQQTPAQSQQTDKKLELPKKKKKAKEPSLFQPKQHRAKTPTVQQSSNSAAAKRSSSVPLVDDDIPLTKLGRSPNSKVSVASPLSSSHTVFQSSGSPEKKKPLSLAKSATNSKPKVSTPRLPAVSTPSPYTEHESSFESPHSKITPHSQVASKKPPSKASTPMITHPDDDDDEDGFGDLANELEEELNDGSFVILDERNNDSEPQVASYQYQSRTSAALNLRSLAGDKNSNDDDDVSSSEEE